MCALRHADEKAVAVAAAADPHFSHATTANVELHLNTAPSAEPKEPKASDRDRNNHNPAAGTSDGAPLEGKSQPMRVATSTQLTTQPTQKSVSFHHEVPRESVNDEREL